MGVRVTVWWELGSWAGAWEGIFEPWFSLEFTDRH